MIIREQSPYRIYWDSLILLLVLLSCTLIPYQLAFFHSASAAHNGLMFAISAIILADNALNFVTTYHQAGAEIRYPKAIRDH